MSILSTNLVARRVKNQYFSRPLITRRKTNGYVFRRALSELKPCIDLRQVRRGRKIFQIPRIIPPIKRQLFGVRQLLSVFTESSRKSVGAPLKGRDSTQGKSSNARLQRGDIRNGGGDLYDSRSDLYCNSSKGNTPIFSDSGWARKQTFRGQTHSHVVTNGHKRFNTRTTLNQENTVSHLSVSYTLGNEVRASSRSQSRTIENKKRVYRVASANRGSIRMSWWL